LQVDLVAQVDDVDDKANQKLNNGAGDVEECPLKRRDVSHTGKEGEKGLLL